jgi:Cu(I)-responsive transcriptional regulator
MNIGQAAQESGLSPKMVRHYERIGLLPAAHRTAAGYRVYGAGEVEVLRFIRQARRLGFSTPQIAGLLSLRGDQARASREVKAIAQTHLEELNEKLAELQRMRQSLESLITRCAGDDKPHCGILDGLAWAAGEQASGRATNRSASKV